MKGFLHRYAPSGNHPKQAFWNSNAELEVLRPICRKNFWAFFLSACGHGYNPRSQRWIDPEIHKPLCDWFQGHVLEWMHGRQEGRVEPKYLAAIIHREIGKTSVLTIAGQLWLHLLDPELCTVTGGEKTELSDKFLGAQKAILDGSDPHAMFTRLYGNWTTEARKWAGTAVTHSARKNTSRPDPSLASFAVEKSLTGAHPDALFYDDPISPERLKTDTDWLSRVRTQVDSLGYVMQGDGLWVFPGTRYDPQDHFGTAIEDLGIASVTGMPNDALQANGGLLHVYFMAGRHQDGRPSTPKVWPESRMRREEKKNPTLFASQILNDPTQSEANPLTWAQVLECMVDLKDVPMNLLRFAICTDVAFSDGRGIKDKDETTFVVHGFPRDGSGLVFIVESHGSSDWREEHFGKRLVATVQRYRRMGRHIFAITGERARAGLKGVLEANLRNHFHDVNEPMPNYIEFERGIQQKYQRLSSACSFWVDGFVKLVRPGEEACKCCNHVGNMRLAKQMATVGQYAINPRTKIDWADAHSDAFQPELYQPMRRTPKKGPWEQGAQAIRTDGMDMDLWQDDDWQSENPRPPLRG